MQSDCAVTLSQCTEPVASDTFKFLTYKLSDNQVNCSRYHSLTNGEPPFVLVTIRRCSETRVGPSRTLTDQPLFAGIISTLWNQRARLISEFWFEYGQRWRSTRNKERLKWRWAPLWSAYSEQVGNYRNPGFWLLKATRKRVVRFLYASAVFRASVLIRYSVDLVDAPWSSHRTTTFRWTVAFSYDTLIWKSPFDTPPVLYRQTFFSSRAICSSEFEWFQVHSVQIGSLDVFWLGRSLVKAHERDKPEPVKCNFKSFWTRHFFSNRA